MAGPPGAGTVALFFLPVPLSLVPAIKKALNKYLLNKRAAAWIGLKIHRKSGKNKELFASSMWNDNITFKRMYLVGFREMHRLANKCSIHIHFALMMSFYLARH